MFIEYLKHLLIRTPLEHPMFILRKLLEAPRRRIHPELHELYLETSRMYELMHRKLRLDSNCVDIGSHLGSMLSQILRLAPEGHHWAFEPIPEKAAWLRAKFPEVEIRAMCLGDASGVVSFRHNLTRSAYSGLMVGGETVDRTKLIVVPCDQLDHVLPPDCRVDFIKMDVEGAELQVFSGAVNTIRRWRPIVLFECTLDGLNSFGLGAEQVWRQVTSVEAYSIFLIKDYLAGGPQLDVQSFQAAMRYPFRAFNFIAAPLDSANSLKSLPAASSLP